MSQLAIGMIETIGLAAAIEAADVCLKSADVILIGYELTKGDGMAVVKIEGNVGAVNAAIDAATVAASKVRGVFSTKVIPRPSCDLDMLLKNYDTVGYECDRSQIDINVSYKENDGGILSNNESEDSSDEQPFEASKSNKKNETIEDENEKSVESNVVEKLGNLAEDEFNNKVGFKENIAEKDIRNTKNLEIDNIDVEKINRVYTCNICRDQNCPRQKGDLKTACIHFKDKSK